MLQLDGNNTVDRQNKIALIYPPFSLEPLLNGDSLKTNMGRLLTLATSLAHYIVETLTRTAIDNSQLDKQVNSRRLADMAHSVGFYT